MIVWFLIFGSLFRWLQFTHHFYTSFLHIISTHHADPFCLNDLSREEDWSWHLFFLKILWITCPVRCLNRSLTSLAFRSCFFFTVVSFWFVCWLECNSLTKNSVNEIRWGITTTTEWQSISFPQELCSSTKTKTGGWQNSNNACFENVFVTESANVEVNLVVLSLLVFWFTTCLSSLSLNWWCPAVKVVRKVDKHR